MRNLIAALVAAVFFIGCSNWNISNEPSGVRNQTKSQSSKTNIGGVNDKVQEVSTAGTTDQVISAWNKQPDSIKTTEDNGNIYTWKNYKPGCDVSLTSDSEGYVSKSAIKSALSQCL